MEHARTQRIGNDHTQRRLRPTRGQQAPEAVLGRVWQSALRWVATHERRSGDDPSFDPRAEAIAQAVEHVQRRSDAAPGRWTRGGGPADRRILDTLCHLALQAMSTAVEADTRRLAILAGIGRDTARVALIRLAEDGWIAQVRPGEGRHAATWTIDPQLRVPTDLDSTQSQGAARPAGAGSRWRNLLLDQLSIRLNLATHDLFTGHTKRIAAGNLYARLNDPHTSTTDPGSLIDDLARAGLIVATPTGWRRTRPELRDLAASRLGVAGRLAAREAATRPSETVGMVAGRTGMDDHARPPQATPPAHGTDCPHVSVGPGNIYPPYPRRPDGRADIERPRSGSPPEHSTTFTRTRHSEFDDSCSHSISRGTQCDCYGLFDSGGYRASRRGRRGGGK
jgi:hypothetical protein